MPNKLAKFSAQQMISGLDGQQLHNEILLRLPRKECTVLFPSLEFIQLSTHTVLHEANRPITHGYFIDGGLASFLNTMENGRTVEVGLAGKEGFVGLPLVVDFSTSPLQVVMQVAGSGFRIRSSYLTQALSVCPELRRELNRFAQIMAMQAAHVAACNQLHEVDERLARWLLMSQDRLGGDRVPLTQEFLAHMLGTRRASVTVAAGVLQKRGLIKYTRGDVRVVKRSELENSACECYQLIVQQSMNWEKESN